MVTVARRDGLVRWVAKGMTFVQHRLQLCTTHGSAQLTAAKLEFSASHPIFWFFMRIGKYTIVWEIFRFANVGNCFKFPSVAGM
jgi:hypothetical protein